VGGGGGGGSIIISLADVVESVFSVGISSAVHDVKAANKVINAIE